MKGFFGFIRDRGVMGLAVGFMLGGAVSKLVTSFVDDIINPFMGLVLGAAGNLSKAYFSIGSAKIMWGSFINTLINFLIIALVVYIGIKLLGLDHMEKKKK